MNFSIVIKALLQLFGRTQKEFLLSYCHLNEMIKRTLINVEKTGIEYNGIVEFYNKYMGGVDLAD